MKLIPTEYTVIVPDHRPYPEIKLVLRHSKDSESEWKWAIQNGSNVLNRDLVWEWEPMPSSRTEEFIASTRFSLEEAKTTLEKYLNAQKKV